jgi:hypothetical protein
VSAPVRARRKTIPAKLRRIVLDDGDAQCAYCWQWSATEVEHVIPVAQGGADDLENLAPACALCNLQKRDRTVEEWRNWRLDNGMNWPPDSRVNAMWQLYPFLTRTHARAMRAAVEDSRSKPSADTPWDDWYYAWSRRVHRGQLRSDAEEAAGLIAVLEAVPAELIAELNDRHQLPSVVERDQEDAA